MAEAVATTLAAALAATFAAALATASARLVACSSRYARVATPRCAMAAAAAPSHSCCRIACAYARPGGAHLDGEIGEISRPHAP